MKRYILLAVIIVVVVGWIGTAIWFGLPDKPDPPAPNPAPTDSIVGPRSVKAGELVVYTTGGDAKASNPSDKKYTKWTILPTGPQTQTTNRAQVFVVVFDLPGEYHIILAHRIHAFDGGINLVTHKVTVGGEGPDPPRPPPLPPGPNPPAPGGWTKWVLDNLPEPYTERKKHITSLAGRLDVLAAQIAAGAVQNPDEARVLLRVSMNEELMKSAKLWVGFSNAFRDRCKELNPKKLKDYRLIYIALAQAFRDFVKASTKVNIRGTYAAAMEASGTDKRPVVVIITSPGCPPCEKLKSEWLPRTTVLGNARIVMLDRKEDAELVDQIATTGMKRSVKVPQIHIVRYVGGEWRQFSKVGYLGYASLNRWVQNVLTWEEK